MNPLLQQALSFHQRGQLAEAESLYRRVLATEPANPAAHYLLGMARLQQGQPAEAVAHLDRAIALDGANPDAHGNRAIALCGLNRFEDALAGFQRAMVLNPKSADYPANRAQALHRLGRRREALGDYDKALKLAPQHFGALAGRGGVQRELGRFDAALTDYEKALALRPSQAELHNNVALVLADMGKLDAALTRLDRALALKADYADAWNNRGCVLQRLDRTGEAIAAFDRALALNPKFADAAHNRGSALAQSGQFAQALPWYDRALTLRPDFLIAWNDRGVACNALRRYSEAIASFDRALALAPDYAPAHNNRGTAFWELGHIDEALATFNTALKADPKLVIALYNRGSLLWAKKQDYAGAVRDIEAALALEPDYPFARGHLLHLKMYAGDWSGFATEKARIDAGVRAGRQVAEPFAYVGLSDVPADLLACTTLYAAAKYPAAPALSRGAVRKPGKIRLGYVSGEFREQATAFLTAGLYEHHDKERFELIAFDNGGSDGSTMRRRLEASFNEFVDISVLSSAEAAQQVQSRDIDILINLNGYFGKMRTDLFALKSAPIQVNYLGFPASMGAPYMDYIVADETVIPENERQFYTEQVVWLPHSYQVNDNKRGPVMAREGRAAHGLPADAFVFCYFNQSYKITPDSFAAWMRILKRVDGSVLWLFENNAMLAGNLRREAEAQGVAASRLVFAPYLEQTAHLTRLPLGDLFLDSLPYGAHTTASDALWAGLPLVTQCGHSFAGRVAASLLKAADLPELIAEDAAAFEELAVTLAQDRSRLGALRAKLAATRDTTSLFDTALFTQGLERAYVTMLETWQRGESPRGFKA